MIKIDEELIGEYLYIKRENKEDVDVNIYIKDSNDKLPLIINIHGGAFIAGDADTLDTQSDRISKDWNVNVVTVSYKLLSDKYDKQYAIDEIKDTVKYFTENEEKYNIDTKNIFIIGYSAGGYYAMASTLQLLVLVNKDPLSEGSLDYQKVLNDDGVKTEIKRYDNVKHGFIEENNPEYEKLNKKNKTSKSSEAEIIAREAEDYIKDWIDKTK